MRHRLLSRWRAESEDLGPNGCQLVTPRIVDEGKRVRLSIRIPELGRAIQGAATVIWSLEAQPSRLGLRFLPGKWDRRWFDSLLAAAPRLASLAQRRPTVLPWRAQLYLGTPRRLAGEYSPDELAVVRRVRPGITVLELVASLGKASDRLVGALFSLVSRRQVVLDSIASPGQGPWVEVLARAEAIEEAEGLTPERGQPTTEVKRLLSAGREHLSAGRVALAAHLFQQARVLAPDDKDARAELRKMGRYG